MPGDIDTIVNDEANSCLCYIDMFGKGTFVGNSIELSDSILRQICIDCQKAEMQCGGPVELEAQIDDSEIAYLQIRTI